uniref:transglycosylase SLT domain-containing protein n=1 Tax=Thaumasiovibrio occultus TaxID=1891184 RepID=UPI000B35D4C0|nr:transglycosylase SLT domain-containing protein [Thaumasiovibrio occultus]
MSSSALAETSQTAVTTTASLSETMVSLADARERETYRLALGAIQEGRLTEAKTLAATISDYPLKPYLDYHLFLYSLPSKSAPQVAEFVNEYALYPFANSVKDRYLRLAAEKGDWNGFLQLQTEQPNTQVYRCYYYQAKAETGAKSEAWQGANEVWLTGDSIDERCDPLLNQWTQAGQRSDAIILERMLLVYAKGETGRLGYLRKLLSAENQAKGAQIEALLDAPEGVGAFAKQSQVTPHNQALTRYAFARLASKSPSQAIAQLDQVVSGQHFNAQQAQELKDVVIRRLFSTGSASLARWRDQALRGSTDISLYDRRVRAALAVGNTSDALTWAQRVPEAHQDATQWVFWQGKLLREKGDPRGEELLRSILNKRDFYSIAAANVLGEPISFPIDDVTANPEAIAAYQPVLARMAELKAFDETLWSAREWYQLMQRVTPEEQLWLAQDAMQRGWFTDVVQATIAGRHWEHLRLRFPFAYEDDFKRMESELGTPFITLMSISRQESAFNPSVTSHAGARGLMQLMPATAKETARAHEVEYAGVDELYQPELNITLGSHYLTDMLANWGDNRILAFASYNAGPHRAQRWLERSAGRLDAYEFVEAIPFRETRGYVKNVLMFEIYYRHLLNQPAFLFTDKEQNRVY